MGYVMAFERLKLVPRRTPELDLVGMVDAEGLADVTEIVDYFIARFLHVRPAQAERDGLVGFLRSEVGADRVAAPDAQTESTLRALLYLVLSTPEYQLA